MFCAQCGQNLAAGAKFCANCGTAAPAPVAPSEVPIPAATAMAIEATTAAAGGTEATPKDAATAAAGGTEATPKDATTSATGEAEATPAEPAHARAEAASTAAIPESPPADAVPAQGLLERIKAILFSPATEWPLIAAEPATTASIYWRYVAPLVLLGVIAGILGYSLIGYDMPFFGHRRAGIVGSVTRGVLQFGFAFFGVFLTAWLIDVLAPTFGGRRDSLSALKATAYSLTPLWLASALQIVPSLGVLASVVGLFYGLYLLYAGLPVLMRSPKDKSIGYVIVVALCSIVMWMLIGMLTTCAVVGLGVAGAGAFGRLGGHDRSTAADDAGDVLSSVFGGKSDADKARVRDALSQLQKMGEEAQKNGAVIGSSRPQSGADVSAAINAVGAIVAGGKDVEPVDFRKLKAMLPDTLAGMKRTESSGQSGEAMGIKGSSATARYGNNAGGSLQVEITDMGSLSGLAGLASKFDPNMEKETDRGYERTAKIDGQIFHERYDRASKSGEVSVIIAGRFSVNVRGDGVSPETLRGAIKQIDVPKLATLAAK